MKNLLFFKTLFILCITFQNCTPTPVPEPLNEWDSICEDYDQGAISLKIAGKDWNSKCVIASQVIVSDSLYQLEYFYVVAYNNGIRFFTDSDIEVFVMSYSKVTSDGETEIASGASFFDGFYDSSRISDPDYEIDGKSFYSDEEDTSNTVTISNINETGASGRIKMILKEDETGEEINVEGSFDVVFDN